MEYMNSQTEITKQRVGLFAIYLLLYPNPVFSKGQCLSNSDLSGLLQELETIHKVASTGGLSVTLKSKEVLFRLMVAGSPGLTLPPFLPSVCPVVCDGLIV